MALPKTYPRPQRGPFGVGASVYVHDQLRKLEDVLERLRNADMTMAQMEQFGRGLTKAHEALIERVRERMDSEAEA